MHLHMPIQKSKHPFQTKNHTCRDRRTFIRWGTLSGTTALTPCTELVCSCLAVSNSLQSGSTVQPPHCKQPGYVERILTAASKAPAFM